MEVELKPNFSVLFYIPNLIGYARLTLVLVAHYIKHDSPSVSLLLLLIFAALDGVDGWAARKFGQCSAFGAWLDVIVDNIGRSIIWSDFSWGFVVSSLEWITFICNHCHGAGWREKIWKDSFLTAPFYVTKVFEKGFKTPYGILAIGGLHCLPIFMFAQKNQFFHPNIIPSWITTICLLVLVLGRLLCAAVELWCVKIHLKCLLTEEKTKSN